MFDLLLFLAATGLAVVVVALIALCISDYKDAAIRALVIGTIFFFAGLFGAGAVQSHRADAPFRRDKPALVEELHKLGYTDIRDMVPINGGYQAYVTTPGGKANVQLTFSKKDGKSLVVTSERTPHLPSMN